MGAQNIHETKGGMRHPTLPPTLYRLNIEVLKDEQFLLESGKRFRKIDFSQAPWDKPD